MHRDQIPECRGRLAVSDPQERRASPRCDTVANRSSIEFATSQGRRRIDARLVNISRDGGSSHRIPRTSFNANLTANRKPRANRLGGRHDRSPRSKSTNRLCFTRGCPDDLLLAGTVGIDLALMVRRRTESNDRLRLIRECLDSRL